MNSTTGVIRIIKKADHPNGYDEHYYFDSVDTDSDHLLMVRVTASIWNAKKFVYRGSEEQKKRINSLLDFVKTCFPKKQYDVEFIPVTIEF